MLYIRYLKSTCANGSLSMKKNKLFHEEEKELLYMKMHMATGEQCVVAL